MMRHMLMGPKMYGEIFVGGQSWNDDPDWKTRCHGLQSELMFFVDGYKIEVALPRKERPYEPKRNAVLRQLHPGEKEVWEYRCTYKPPLRVFGRFAAKDYFVALDLDRRANLPKPPWTKEINNCQSSWNLLLPSCKPVSGALDDYLSNARLI